MGILLSVVPLDVHGSASHVIKYNIHFIQCCMHLFVQGGCGSVITLLNMRTFVGYSVYFCCLLILYVKQKLLIFGPLVGATLPCAKKLDEDFTLIFCKKLMSRYLTVCYYVLDAEDF